MRRTVLRPHRLLACSLATALLLLAGSALAQTGEQKEAADFAVSGVVQSVDAAARSITIQGPNQDGGTYDVDPKAVLKNGDATIGLAEVKTGWQVSVNGDLRGAKQVVTYLSVDDTP